MGHFRKTNLKKIFSFKYMYSLDLYKSVIRMTSFGISLRNIEMLTGVSKSTVHCWKHLNFFNKPRILIDNNTQHTQLINICNQNPFHSILQYKNF